jgi:hypothetical protein
MYPTPQLIVGPFAVSGEGDLALTTSWPVGVPSSVSFYYQWWVIDAAGPAGFSSSNGLQSTTP